MSRGTNQRRRYKKPRRPTLVQRLGNAGVWQWLMACLVTVVFFGLAFWQRSPWPLLLWLLLIDIMLTKFVPWDWWTRLRNRGLRTVIRLAVIVFWVAVIVWSVFTFVGLSYRIPSSSLEKTLLVGDHVWVNKMVYGPRVPFTKKYHRLKGVRNVERNDIVVFNYPCGDTVIADGRPGEDYYTMCMSIGRVNVLRRHKVEYRPVDSRDAYIKRCVGLPGERVSCQDGVVHINGKAIAQPKNAQFLYSVDTRGKIISDDEFAELGIAKDDRQQEKTGGRTLYIMPLTSEMANKLQSRYGMVNVKRVPPFPGDNMTTFPAGYDYGWNHNTFKDIWIPKKGESIMLNEKTYALYERCIRAYEGNTFERRGGKYYINGQQASSYTFQMDYYWMMGDNRDSSLDSRYWGFVPEDHIIGLASFIVISNDEDTGMRWSRFFNDANPDK